MIFLIDKFCIWYQKQTFLRGAVKYIGFGGFDFYFAERANKVIKQITKVSYDGIDKLIEIINGSLEIGSLLSIVVNPSQGEAQFMSDGPLESSKLEERAEQKIIDSFPLNYTNDICAAVINKPHWKDEPLTIRYNEVSYAGILSRRKRGLYTGIVSSNVLLLCEEEECLILHRRSNSQFDYANKLHTFGGAFIPTGPREDFDIKMTAKREILEESAIGIRIPKSIPQIIIDEHEIEFIQTAFIGFNITSKQLRDKKGNWEGDPVLIKFSELHKIMYDLNEWTPTGWVHTLFWLALNSPGLTKPILFGGKSGPELSKSIAQKCLTRQ